MKYTVWLTCLTFMCVKNYPTHLFILSHLKNPSYVVDLRPLLTVTTVLSQFMVSHPPPGGGPCGGIRLRLTEHGPAGGPPQQHEEQQQRRWTAAGVFHGGGPAISAVGGDPVPGGQRHLLQGRVRQELRRHGCQALWQDGAVHGGGDQVQIAAPQHAAGERMGGVSSLFSSFSGQITQTSLISTLCSLLNRFDGRML